MSTHNICFHGEILKNIMWILPLIWRYALIVSILLSFQSTGFSVPKFNLTSWSPEPPAGLHYMCLLPVAIPQTYTQDEHVGKLKTSAAHRKQRLKEFTSGRTTCRNILGV